MVRKCRGLCSDHEFFSKTKLPYSEGSFCPTCDIWVKRPTHIPIDFRIATTNEGNNERYYNEKGKQVEVLILSPIRQIAWRTPDEKGALIKMIDELVGKVKCRCCGTICRGGPLSKTDERKTKRKTLLVIDKVGNEIKPIRKKIKWIKPTPREWTKGGPIGRPEGSKTRIKTKEEIEQGIDNEKRYFEELQRRLNLNREAIIDTPDENLTLVERIMKHDPTYWRILSRKIKKQIMQDSWQDNLTPTRKETKRGSRFTSNYYAEDRDSKFNKFDIKSFREDLFKEWQEHNKRIEHYSKNKRIVKNEAQRKTNHDN